MALISVRKHEARECRGVNKDAVGGAHMGGVHV